MQGSSLNVLHLVSYLTFVAFYQCPHFTARTLASSFSINVLILQVNLKHSRVKSLSELWSQGTDSSNLTPGLVLLTHTLSVWSSCGTPQPRALNPCSVILVEERRLAHRNQSVESRAPPRLVLGNCLVAVVYKKINTLLRFWHTWAPALIVAWTIGKF